ncbi:MAG: GNAT family N-acetyltransferase [Prolixibacteraceae bacterium]|nr:GNAT family N-acetyltransferase [Prolixibacteraceae bacterium]
MKKEITLAGSADIEELTVLLQALFSQDIEFQPDYIKQKSGLEMIIKNPLIGEILVLKIDGKIAGMVSLLYSISTVLGGKVAILEDMVIDENYRNKSFGMQLLNSAIQHAKQTNCLRITLLTDFNNDIAIRFYQKAGFNKSKMIPMRLVFD